jgi:hypothetical protein
MTITYKENEKDKIVIQAKDARHDRVYQYFDKYFGGKTPYLLIRISDFCTDKIRFLAILKFDGYSVPPENLHSLKIIVELALNREIREWGTAELIFTQHP